MKTLYLMRHAKSTHDMQGITDIDRPLLQQGIEDTRRISDYLKDSNIRIKNIVSSPAVRAYETAVIVADEFNIQHDAILTYDELYMPDIPGFEDCIFSLPDDWDHVLIVSHNPGISMFAESLNAFDEETIPTSGVISVSFEMERWINLYASSAVVNFFIHPKNVQLK